MKRDSEGNVNKQISVYVCRIWKQQDKMLVSEGLWFPFVTRWSGLWLSAGEQSVWRA